MTRASQNHNTISSATRYTESKKVHKASSNSNQLELK